MKASEIKYLTDAELDTKLTELKQELFNLRFQMAVNQKDGSPVPMRMKAIKKDIARIKTIQRERQQEGMPAKLEELRGTLKSEYKVESKRPAPKKIKEIEREVNRANSTLVNLRLADMKAKKGVKN